MEWRGKERLQLGCSTAWSLVPLKQSHRASVEIVDGCFTPADSTLAEVKLPKIMLSLIDWLICTKRATFNRYSYYRSIAWYDKIKKLVIIVTVCFMP